MDESPAGAVDARRSLAKLSLDDRVLLVLRFLHGYRAEELAAVDGISPQAVRKRISRARARLRRLLAQVPPEQSRGQAFAVDVATGRVRPLTRAEDDLWTAALSLDGRTAYVSKGCGRDARTTPVIVAIPWSGGRSHEVARGACTLSTS